MNRLWAGVLIGARCLELEEIFRGERDPICVFLSLLSSNRLLRSILTLSLGELGARGMQVIAIIILARRLGSELFGYFILATTITTYLLLFVQLGLASSRFGMYLSNNSASLTS